MRWINRVPVLIPLGGRRAQTSRKRLRVGTSAPSRGVSWGRSGAILSPCSWEDTQNTLEGLYLYHWSGNTQVELEHLAAEKNLDGCMDDFWHIDLRKLLLTLISFCFALKFWTQDVSLSLPACCWGRGCRPENKNNELELSKKLHKSQQNCSRWFIVIFLFHITQLFNPLKGRCVLRRETQVSFPTVAV